MAVTSAIDMYLSLLIWFVIQMGPKNKIKVFLWCGLGSFGKGIQAELWITCSKILYSVCVCMHII